MLIPKKNSALLVAVKTNPENVAQIMSEVINELAASDQLTNELTNELFRISTDLPSFLFNVCNFAYQTAYFVPHPPDKQTIRTVRRVLMDKAANCVDYTVLIGAICKCAGLNVVIRIVKINNDHFQHVYPVVNNTPLDVTITQDQTGREREKRISTQVGIIGVEFPYKEKKDIFVA